MAVRCASPAEEDSQSITIPSMRSSDAAATIEPVISDSNCHPASRLRIIDITSILGLVSRISPERSILRTDSFSIFTVGDLNDEAIAAAIINRNAKNARKRENQIPARVARNEMKKFFILYGLVSNSYKISAKTLQKYDIAPSIANFSPTYYIVGVIVLFQGVANLMKSDIILTVWFGRIILKVLPNGVKSVKK